MRSFFYTVPPGVSALRADIDQPKRDIGVEIVKPDTRTANATRTAPIGAATFLGLARTSRATYVVSDPMPGVWEITLSDLEDAQSFDRMQAESNEPAPPTPVTLTVSVIAAEVNIAQTGSPGGSGGALSDQLSIRNRLASFNGGVSALPSAAPTGSACQSRKNSTLNTVSMCRPVPPC